MLEHEWAASGGGFSKVDEFGPAASTADYLTKIGLDGGEQYEVGKFGWADCAVTFSASLLSIREQLGHIT